MLALTFDAATTIERCRTLTTPNCSDPKRPPSHRPRRARASMRSAGSVTSAPSLGAPRANPLAAERSQTRATQPGRLLRFEGRQSTSETKGDAQLEKLQTKLRPRLREKDPQRLAWKRPLALSVCFSLLFSTEVCEARAPKLLHVGRRSADPGSKSRRVAWKTSFGRGRTSQKTRLRLKACAAASISNSGDGRSGERSGIV